MFGRVVLWNPTISSTDTYRVFIKKIDTRFIVPFIRFSCGCLLFGVKLSKPLSLLTDKFRLYTNCLSNSS